MPKIITIPKIVTVVFVISIILAVYGFTLFSNEKPSPNVIVIMVDDLDVKTLKTMLEKNLMPNLNTFLVEKGIDFQNSFVTNSACCPSRSTFLTGQYSHNHNVLTNTDAKNLDDGHTLATWLDNSGYRTGLVGKYLNGYGKVIDSTYLPPGWDDWKALVDPSTYFVYNYTINENGSLRKYGDDPTEYQTDVLAGLASNFIYESKKNYDSTAFFLFVTPMAPHAENFNRDCLIRGPPIGIIRPAERHSDTLSIVFPSSPSFNEDDVTDKPPWIQNYPTFDNIQKDCIEKIYTSRIESTLAIDDLIGIIFHALIDTDILENTVIIFTSDNGFLLGEHREIRKLYAYEESIRVPLYIRMPDYEGPKNSKILVTNNDLAPTILELTGAEADILIDGRSLITIISNPKEDNWRNNFLIEHWTSVVLPVNYKAVRTTSHIYIEYDEFREFYDLEKDPFQLNNMYDCIPQECRQQIEILEEIVHKLANCSGTTCQDLENTNLSKMEG